jgi:glycosyltransferase involved in cell wall biosynthesis
MTLKKILFLCFSSGRGGMEIDVIKMCQRVSKYAEVTLIGMAGSPIEEMAIKDSKSCFLYKFTSTKCNRFLSRALIDPRLVLSVRSEIKSTIPDLVVFFGTSEIKSIGIALCGLQTKLILRVGTTMNYPKNNLVQKFTYKRADGFITISEHIQKNLKKMIPVANLRPVQICYPVIERYPSKPLSQLKNNESINVIYHSRIVRGKGQLDAVKAISHVLSMGISLKLTLIGAQEDVTYLDEIQSYIALNKIEKNIVITGNKSDVTKWLEASDIYLGPTYGEGFSNSFVEALTAGLVCVTYDNTVFPDFKKMGFDFFICKTGDVEILAETLMRAILAYRKKTVNTQNNKELGYSLFSKHAERVALESIFNKVHSIF